MRSHWWSWSGVHESMQLGTAMVIVADVLARSKPDPLKMTQSTIITPVEAEAIARVCMALLDSRTQVKILTGVAALEENDDDRRAS